MATSKEVNNLTINKVESQEVYNYMASNNLINEDELYLVEGDEYTNATQSKSGLMSNIDKSKLDGIADGANKTIVDSSLSTTSTNPVQNKVIKTELDKKADKTALDAKADKTALDGKLDKTGGTLTGNLTGKYLTGTWLQTTAATDLGRTPGKVAVLDDSGWVYYRTPAEIKSDIGADAVVTTSSNGLMSASDKSKLDGIAAGANKITVDTSLSSTSTNPVQNKIVNDALEEKFSKSGGDISGDVFMLKSLDLNGVLILNGALTAHETILAKKGVQCLYDDNLRIRLACDSSGAAKITTDGLHSYARLKIASPTDNNDAATKNYVDDALSGKAGTAVATTSANGLMSAADKKKLDGIAAGATKIKVDTALSITSTNPVQNKVINSALSKKAGTDVATTSANGLMSAADKTKLTDITDYIAEWGTTGIWTYRKWHSGIAECWGT